MISLAPCFYCTMQSQSIQSSWYSVQSSELGPPIPAPAASVAPPLLVQGGATHSLGREGVGGPDSDEGTETLILYACST
jgi:hypothetical protein